MKISRMFDRVEKKVSLNKAQKMRKLTIYLLTSLLVLVISWENQRSVSASLLDSPSINSPRINQNNVIPDQAMRLRILANSDSPQDQWLKREIRDAVVAQVSEWVEELETIEVARAEVQHSMEELEAIVEQTIQGNGFNYSYKIEYGQIEFPTKLYGNKLYPAGEYEGLLITIGTGQGDNWWCVLFPPLCFVDFGTGEVLDPDQEAKELGDAQQLNESASQVDQIEVRFFLVEIINKVKNFFA
jgi:stage II sporulation protein R